MKILLLYQFYYPDDVAGAQQFTGLGAGLVQRGFEVEVWPSNRSCHRRAEKYPAKPEVIEGVKIRRIWRPNFNQHRFLGRIFNALWMEKAWLWRALFTQAPDVVILGTDPIFAVLLAPFLKLRWPKIKLIHWCFDLYPDYAVAEGMVSEKGFVVGLLERVLKPAYRAFDLVADLGPCMRERLARYPIRKFVTLSPWALEEPKDPLPIDKEERRALFGEASLGLLYSGNLSRPHEFESTVALARKLKVKAALVFSARGQRVGDLMALVTAEDTNIHSVPFAPADRLKARLSAPDIHVVSLKSSYTGVAVPSKFFGALAAGRPILFEGDETSSIARWVREYGLGWVLTPGHVDELAEGLMAFAADETRKQQLFRHCHQVYQERFSKKAVVDGWERELKEMMSGESGVRS
ncbi:MAG TPA: glycosyltransferase family 4 protein [bacterium]|nr:glycosyltransferase family 4 protein [bacterium]